MVEINLANPALFIHLENTTQMDNLNRSSLRAALCGGALLLCLACTAGADEIQDINKLFKQGQHAQALERVNTYLASSPKDAQARFLKGLILTEQGQTNNAISQFSTLTEDYPELPEPYNNLAVLYASQGQYDQAKVALEMAIRTHPSYATAHENLGDIYARMASQAYDRALQLDRSNTGTQTKLAMIKDLFTDSSKSGKPIAAAPGITAGPASASKLQAVAPAATPALAKVSATPSKAPPVTGKSSAAASEEAMKMVHDWAAAWSSKNASGYLAFYAKDFKTPNGESRDHWQTSRTERISKPEFIQVGISNAAVSFTDDSHASITFLQSYQASHLKISSSKILLLVNVGGKWLIQEERSGK